MNRAHLLAAQQKAQRRRVLVLPLALAVGLALALALLGLGCSKVYEYPKVHREDTATRCADGIDNDLDGVADCYDSECASFCREDSEVTCSDGLDNDVDGARDCHDADCAEFCREASSKTCRDGVDNDLDGSVDCRDPDCAAFCPETGPLACANGDDDDSDGLVDCADPDCDGNCPEESAAACADGRDNDGDGLLDTADPRCWLHEPPTVQRCASPEIDFREHFEEAFFYGAGQAPAGDFNQGQFDGRWAVSGSIASAGGAPVVFVYKHQADPIDPYRNAGRDDYDATFNGLGDDGFGRMVSKQVFAGSWSDFELAFSAKVDADSVLEVSLVPKNAATRNRAISSGSDAALSVQLSRLSAAPEIQLVVDGSSVAERLPVAPFQACGQYPCDNNWVDVKLDFVDGALRAVAKGQNESVTLTSAPLNSLVIPESKLVLSGGSLGGGRLASVDDVRAVVHAHADCGFASPQIPTASCDYAQAFEGMGRTLALVQTEDDQYCALVEADRGDGSQVLTPWTSQDGGQWTPAGGAASDAGFALPVRASLGGVGLTRDGATLLAAAVVHESQGTRLALGEAKSCADFAQFSWGPRLPDDAEGPSYLMTAGRHEVYVTRPPTSAGGRSLWRLSGADQDHLELEPKPLAELPLDAQIRPPVSISRVGTQDLVMVYPTPTGSPGLGAAIGSADGREWQSLPQIPLLASQGGTFDAEGCTAGALSFDDERGLLLYGGSSLGRVATGVARLFRAGLEPTRQAYEACGDGVCTPGETCSTCAEDCQCPGKLLSDGDLSQAAPAWKHSSDVASSVAYFDASTASIITQVAQFGAWSVFPLQKGLVGDFELEFDLTVPTIVFSGNVSVPLDSLYIGVGTPPERIDARPVGAFARVTTFPAANNVGACFAEGRGYSLSPFVGSDAGYQSTLKFATAECDDGRLLLPFDVVRHIQLKREAGVVSVTALNGDGCPETVSLSQTQALPGLSALVIGTFNTWLNAGGTVEISRLALRLLDDPQHCPKGRVACGAEGEERTCVDTERTPEHCGGCGAACKPGAACVDGRCACPEGLADCADECADTQSSANNCGGCGINCATHCLGGECDVGETCADPKVLPAGAGTYLFDLRQAQAEAPGCGGSFPLSNDLFFRWTSDVTGNVVFSLRGVGALASLWLSVTTDPDCQLYGLTDCDGSGNPPGATLKVKVERGQTYYIGVVASVEATGPATLSIELP